MADLSAGEWAVLVPGLVAIVAVSVWLSVIDWREHRLPNKIVAPLAAAVAGWVLALGVVTNDGARSIEALGWGVAGFSVFFVLNLLAGVGMGDVKYAFPVCVTLGWFGWRSLEVGFYALVVSAGLVGLLTIAQGKGRQHRIAFGPYMTFGLVCGIAWGLIG